MREGTRLIVSVDGAKHMKTGASILGGRGIASPRFWDILIISYNVQEYEMKTRSKVLTFQK